MVVICPRCGKEIEPVRKVGWRWFALWLLLGMVPALIYVFYHFTKVPRNCLFCGYRDVYDEGEQLEWERTADLRRQPLEKRRISKLKQRLLYLDKALKNPKKISQQEREEFTREINEVAKELRKYGFKGAVEERKGFSSEERKY